MEIKTRIDLPLLLKHFKLPLLAVEVGCAGCSNSVDLLKAGIEHIFCVDNWEHMPTVTGDGNYPNKFHEDNYKLALEILKPFEGRYTILKGLSSQMHINIENGTLGLVYLDGGHDYETVRSDIYDYFHKLVPGGIIGFHDYPNYSGVFQAVNEFAQSRNLIIHNIPEDCRENAGCWLQI